MRCANAVQLILRCSIINGRFVDKVCVIYNTHTTSILWAMAYPLM